MKPTPPNPSYEDAHFEALTNVLTSSFLGNLVQRSTAEETVGLLSYILNLFSSGPIPPFKDWCITGVVWHPQVRLNVAILTHQDVEHQISIRVDDASLDEMIKKYEQSDREEEGGEDEDTPHIS